MAGHGTLYSLLHGVEAQGILGSKQPAEVVGNVISSKPPLWAAKQYKKVLEKFTTPTRDGRRRMATSFTSIAPVKARRANEN